MELKLSSERFDEIQKLITENPKKALKTVKKEELLDFVSDLRLISFDTSSALEEKNAECKRLSRERDLAMMETKIKAKSCNNLQEQVQELKSQVTVAEDHANCQCQNYEKVLKGLKWYRLAVVILAVIVILQWIF